MPEYPYGQDPLGRYLVPLRDLVVRYSDNSRCDGCRPETGYEGIAELAAELRRGATLIHPVTVGEEPSDGRLYLAAGFRRYDAAAMAGLSHIPAQIRVMTAAERRAINLAENRSRKDTSSYDVARGFARLRELDGQSSRQIAAATGYTLAYVGQLLAQLDGLHPTLIALWRAGDARLRTHTRRLLLQLQLTPAEQLDYFALGPKQLRAKVPSTRQHGPRPERIREVLEQLGGRRNQSKKKRFATTLLRWVLSGHGEQVVLEELGLRSRNQRGH